MKITREQPTSGNFIKIWMYGGLLWSDSFRWEDGELECFDELKDEWEYSKVCLSAEISNVHYITP